MSKQPSWLDEYQCLIENGYSQRESALILGIPRTTIQYRLKKWHNHLEKSVEEVESCVQEPLKRSPVITLLDIETAPLLAYAWGRFDQNISQEAIVMEGYVLCASWKKLGEQSIHSIAINEKDDFIDGNDRIVLERLHTVFEESDFIVAHNGKRFDVPYVKARMIALGMKPLKNVRVIDTLTMSRKYRFPSNKLDSLGAYLGVGRKVSHDGFALWKACMKGCKEAMKKMVEYNKGDIELLEKVYLILRSWDTSHPFLGNYYEDDLLRCPSCGSEHVSETGQYEFSGVSKFAEYECKTCGRRSKLAVQLNSIKKRKTILR